MIERLAQMPTIMLIPAFGAPSEKAFAPEAGHLSPGEEFADPINLLPHLQREVTLFLHYRSDPAHHFNPVASRFATVCTGVEHQIHDLAVITATTGEAHTCIPEHVHNLVHALSAVFQPDTQMASPALQAISDVAGAVQAMLAARPDHDPDDDPRQQIIDAMRDLLTYAGVVNSHHRDPNAAATILAEALAEVADRARDDMAAIEFGVVLDSTAPGFLHEAGRVIGSLLSQAQSPRNRYGGTKAFALLREALMAHQMNTVFDPDALEGADAIQVAHVIANIGDALAALFAQAEQQVGNQGPLLILQHALSKTINDDA